MQKKATKWIASILAFSLVLAVFIDSLPSERVGTGIQRIAELHHPPYKNAYYSPKGVVVRPKQTQMTSRELRAWQLKNFKFEK